MEPILHLSLPVRDLAESRWFYLDLLGCDPGRAHPGWMDVWFYGMQVTLHEQPDQVLAAEEVGVRHFGVTLSEEHFDALVAHLGEYPVEWLRPVTTDYGGTSRQQTKATIADPSGNAIELKWYAQPTIGLDRPVRDPTHPHTR